jgi:hypothetical protein
LTSITGQQPTNHTAAPQHRMGHTAVWSVQPLQQIQPCAYNNSFP